MTADYVLSNQWERERERLDSQAGGFDPASLAFCREAGLQQGARVLEVGPGTGRFAQLMADVVGPSGEVVAVDIDINLAASLPGRTFTLVDGDVRDGTVPAGPFDLVHARLVIGHLQDRRAAIEMLITRLRPGGWLVIEEFDRVTSTTCHPASDSYVRVLDAIWGVMAAGSYEGTYGRALREALGDLDDVETDGAVELLRGDDLLGVPQLELILDQLEARVRDVVGDAAIAEFKRLMHDPTFSMFGPVLVRARGRRREAP
jgi:SAM-dependent methyltransferase